ncbi:hypothetical protein PWT90_05999 [Aphanocladium album]|nr:hypothetical protein PWT90_05999 [Aphanocladium album]
MASSAISLQWGLDATATGTLSLARGLVMAATADNVSILALMACEGFGGTLPASAMSIQKVEGALVPRTAAPVAFLKATVGFLHNDCAVQLGKSAAGIRFLVFAAALIPTAGVFQSAAALDKMLRSSASDLTVVPPLQALRDLLKVLEPRMPACGFFDSVVFCQKLIEEHIIPRVLYSNIPSEYSCQDVRLLELRMLEGVPPPETLIELINAFRQLGRLGHDTIEALTIRTGIGIPWLLAFAQWCLDSPISLSIGDFRVLAPADAKVHFLIPENIRDLERRIKISIHHRLENLETLVQTSSRDSIKVESASYSADNRLVTLEAYWEFTLRELGFDNCSLDLLREAIEYSIPIALSHLNRSYNPGSEPERCPEELDHLHENELEGFRLSPLPSIHVVLRVTRKLLAVNGPFIFKRLDEGQFIKGLPQVSRHLAQLQQISCHECNVRDMPNGGTGSEAWDIGHCSEDHFFRSLASLTFITSATKFTMPYSLDSEIS